MFANKKLNKNKFPTLGLVKHIDTCCQVSKLRLIDKKCVLAIYKEINYMRYHLLLVKGEDTKETNIRPLPSQGKPKY